MRLVVVVCPGGPLCACWAFLGPLVGWWELSTGPGPGLAVSSCPARAEPGRTFCGRGLSSAAAIRAELIRRVLSWGLSGLIRGRGRSCRTFILTRRRVCRFRGVANICSDFRGVRSAPGAPGPDFGGAWPYLYSPGDFPGDSHAQKLLLRFSNFSGGIYSPGAFLYILAFSQYFSVFRVFSAIFSKIISDFVLFRFALVWRGLAAWVRARRELSGIAGMLARSSNRRQMIKMRRGLIKLGDGAGAEADPEQATEAKAERETENEMETEIETGSGNGIRNRK